MLNYIMINNNAVFELLIYFLQHLEKIKKYPFRYSELVG